jgi:3-deoxy-7-phosphoheptulonate synthase
MPIVTEIVDGEDIDLVGRHADIYQVGMRNMRNYALLSKLGKTNKPVLLKRGDSAKLEEWLAAADYIVRNGNENVILCERGIRTFEDFTRNTLDLSAVAGAKLESCLPVLADPSHGTGRADLVAPMCRSAVAAGADGLLLEVHFDPDQAWSDGMQTITPDALARIIESCRRIHDICRAAK